MVKLKAQVVVMLKPVVNDPQGLTVRSSLHRLGFEEVNEVRVGKFVEITLTAANEADGRREVSEMCRRLLANHVIEDVRFQVETVADREKAGAAQPE